MIRGEGGGEGEGQLQLMTKIPYSLSFIFSSIDQRQSVSHTVVHLSRSMSLLLLERLVLSLEVSSLQDMLAHHHHHQLIISTVVVVAVDCILDDFFDSHLEK